MVVYTYLCVWLYIYLFIYILQYIFLPSFLTILYKLKYINILVKTACTVMFICTFLFDCNFPLQCQTSGKWDVQYLCQHSVLFNMYTICQGLPTSWHTRYWSMAQTVGTWVASSWYCVRVELQARAQISRVLPTALSPTPHTLWSPH